MICPIILGIFLMSLVLMFFKNINYEKIKEPETNLPAQANTATVTQSALKEKPKYFYLNNANAEPKVSALAYLVGDLNTGEVILSKNQEKQFPIASITKLMTAVVTRTIMAPAKIRVLAE